MKKAILLLHYARTRSKKCSPKETLRLNLFRSMPNRVQRRRKTQVQTKSVSSARNCRN